MMINEMISDHHDHKHDHDGEDGNEASQGVKRRSGRLGGGGQQTVLRPEQVRVLQSSLVFAHLKGLLVSVLGWLVIILPMSQVAVVVVGEVGMVAIEVGGRHRRVVPRSSWL